VSTETRGLSDRGARGIGLRRFAISSDSLCSITFGPLCEPLRHKL
jgi:hypothetical protein